MLAPYAEILRSNGQMGSQPRSPVEAEEAAYLRPRLWPRLLPQASAPALAMASTLASTFGLGARVLRAIVSGRHMSPVGKLLNSIIMHINLKVSQRHYKAN